MSHYLHHTSKKTQHLQASIVQRSIPIAISNGSIAIVVFNEKLNNPVVSFPASEQTVINSYFIASLHETAIYTTISL